MKIELEIWLRNPRAMADVPTDCFGQKGSRRERRRRFEGIKDGYGHTSSLEATALKGDGGIKTDAVCS